LRPIHSSQGLTSVPSPLPFQVNGQISPFSSNQGTSPFPVRGPGPLLCARPLFRVLVHPSSEDKLSFEPANWLVKASGVGLHQVAASPRRCSPPSSDSCSPALGTCWSFHAHFFVRRIHSCLSTIFTGSVQKVPARLRLLSSARALSVFAA